MCLVVLNKILYDDEARSCIIQGMTTLAETVSITLGPKGRNVVLGNQFGIPRIINDGVTIAKELHLYNTLEHSGASLIRQAASKTNKIAGDGTTTSTVIAYRLIRYGLKNLAAGINPIILKRGMKRATIFLMNQIYTKSKPLEKILQIKNIAIIASGNDIKVGNFIYKAIKTVGREGLISIEETKSIYTVLEVEEGMGLTTGFISSYFINDTRRMELILDNTLVLLTNKKIETSKIDLLSTLELLTKTRHEFLVIVADNVKDEALSTLILNNLKGILKIIAIRAPGHGIQREVLLGDLAVLTGGSIIRSDAGYSLQNIKLSLFGCARRVIAEKHHTIFISDMNKFAIFLRCEQLRRQLEIVESSFNKDQIQERLTKLSGGVAIIKVGATTGPEVRDIKLRLEDAINATKAAIEEGIVSGGSASLAHIAPELLLWARKTLVGDELVGALIVEKSITFPFKTIVTNSGKNGSFILKRIQQSNFEIGYDANVNEIFDVITAGVIDPSKVTRTTIQNGTSIASMIMTTECLVFNEN